MQWQERLRSLPLPLTLSYPMKDHHFISCSSGHGMKCSLNSLSHLEAARLDFKATADCRVPFSLSDLEDIVVCARSVHRVPVCFESLNNEAMNHKTQDDVYGGRLITAKNNQSETSANARALERGVVTVLCWSRRSRSSHCEGRVSS